VLFVSSDSNDYEYDDFVADMPWLMVPFE